MDTIAVLFVCAGNICRSPMADAVFQHLVIEEGLGDRFVVDSAGTGGWHTGDPPHPKTIEELKLHGIDGSKLTARQVSRHDLDHFDYVVAMDEDNLSGLHMLARDTHARVTLLLDHAEDVDVREVPDPYYIGGYDKVYELVDAGCRGLLADICEREGI